MEPRHLLAQLRKRLSLLAADEEHPEPEDETSTDED